MKLFLSSMSISYEQAPAFLKLVGKEAKDTKIALIENAADVETGDKSWMDENRLSMQALGFQVTTVDLEKFRDGARKEPLASVLGQYDAIWLGGGNTYYLRWLLQETRADEVIKGLVASGKVYGGGSAGAIVAGPTLKHFDKADDPSAAPERIDEGLGLTNTVVVPHWQNEKFGKVMSSVAAKLEADSYKIQKITDKQALSIDGSNQQIVPEP